MELMASNNTSCNLNNMHFHTSTPPNCWDLLHQHYYLPNVGLVNSNFSPYYEAMEETNNVMPSSMMLPFVAHDNNNSNNNTKNDKNSLSTGYLEDALIEFSVRFKRRRLQFSGDDDSDHVNHHYSGNFLPHFTSDELSYLSNDWSSNYNMQLEEDLSHDSFPSHEVHYSSLETNKEGLKLIETKGESLLEETRITNNSNSKKLLEASSPPNSKEMMKSNTNFTFYSPSLSYNSDTTLSTDSSFSEEKEKRKAKRGKSSDNSTTKMIYPFGLVKPGGSEGDITLKDINKRILMPPTRPLKHPVGDFACRPAVSPHGPGLSGKAVVALTKIHTQGSGTITIIRTKG